MADERPFISLPDSTFNHVEARLPQLYLAFALTLTTLLCFVTAPFFTPDEANQAARAISLSHGELIAFNPGKESGGDVDEGALAAMDGMNGIRMAWEKRSINFRDRNFGAVDEALQRPLDAIGWTHSTVFVPYGNTAVYPPALYLPAVIGFRIAEAANLTIFNSLRLVRLFSALTAVGLGWLALRLCACSRWLLLPLLLLPSTLFLNASCSQDAILLSVAALAGALLSRPLVAARAFTSAELAVMALLLAPCGTARPPYAGLALALFVPAADLRAANWRQNWRNNSQRWLAPGIAFTAVMTVCALWRYLVVPLGLDWSDQADPDTQTAFMQTHPLATFLAMLNGVRDALLDFLLRGTYVIGWNDLLPHHGASAILVACLAAMLLLAPACPLRSWRSRVLLAATIASPLLGISLAEYIIWTPPGYATVFGIQPRYLLPLMPFAGLLLQGRLPLPRLSPALRSRLLLTATAVLAAAACTLPWVAAQAFYRTSFTDALRLNLP